MDEKVAAPTPSPGKSGVDGNQIAGQEADIAADSPPLSGEYLERTFIGLAADQPHNFGGDLGAPMIRAMISQCLHDKNQAVDEAARRQTKLDELAEQVNSLRTQLALSRASLDASNDKNRIHKVCTFLSPVFLAFGIDLYKAQFNYALIAFVVGVVLLGVNFLPSRGKGNAD